MLNLFLVFLLFSITILIVASTVYLKFTYTDTLSVKIDFLLFTLLLYQKDGEPKKSKAKSYSGFKQGIKKSTARRRTLYYLLKNSSLTVHSINIPQKNADPSTAVMLGANVSSVILILFTYLSLKTQSISLEDNYFLTPYDERFKEPILDFTLKTSLLVFIFASILYNLELYKLKRNERLENNSVRNKNG